jgi:hypothetical protein
MYTVSEPVIDSDTIHGKCRILRLKMILFQVSGPCNLIGGYEGFSQDVLPPSSDGL